MTTPNTPKSLEEISLHYQEALKESRQAAGAADLLLDLLRGNYSDFEMVYADIRFLQKQLNEVKDDIFQLKVNLLKKGNNGSEEAK